MVFADVNREAAEKAAAGFDEKRVRVIRADVSDDESVKALVKGTVDAFGRMDVLVNCAGVPQAFTPIEELSPKQWDRIMSVNAKSIFLIARHVVPIMKKRKSGSIDGYR